MTKKLYDISAYDTEFEATVLSCKKCEKGFEIILDKTLFFPEEGGQCCDKGFLNETKVTDVQINGDTIYHYCEKELAINSTVQGKIDFDLRYRNMQNHTGEHIICGIAHKIYGYENVGFHLGEDYVTMDLSGPLTPEQIKEIEMLANIEIYKINPIKAYYPSKQELTHMFYRSKDNIEGDIRIVEIETCDVCACCAPHVARTGEVGIIKIIDSFPHRGGVRLTILCGKDALNDYIHKFNETLEISNLLSVKQNETASGVKKLLDDMGKLRHELGEKNKTLAAMYVDTVKETQGNVCIFNSDLDRDAMRIIVNGIMPKVGGVAAVMSGCDETGYSYIIGSVNIDLKEKSANINTALSGKGGGNKTMIQGSFGATKEKIENYFKTEF